MTIRSLLPFGSRRSLATANELNPFATLQREIDRLFADFGRGWPGSLAAELTPCIDVVERDKEIAVTAELPGLEEKDVEITVADGVLTIRGEKKAEKEEKNDNRHIVERSYGAFVRSVALPDGVKADDIKASMAKGVLTVTVPKPALPKSEAKKIEVKAAA